MIIELTDKYTIEKHHEYWLHSEPTSPVRRVTEKEANILIRHNFREELEGRLEEECCSTWDDHKNTSFLRLIKQAIDHLGINEVKCHWENACELMEFEWKS